MKKLSFALAVVVALLSIPFFKACSCDGKTARTVYMLDCVFNDDYTLSGKETVTFYNDTENTVTELKFNLFGNAFRNGAKYSPISAQYRTTAYPNGMNYGETEILRVTENGREVNGIVGGVDRNIFTVPLSQEVYPEEYATVTMEFTLKLADVIARTGYNSTTVNLANFYPILCGVDDNGFYECVYYANGDPFFSDVADYTVSMTLDSEYVIASAGELVSSVTSDGISTVTYKLENARSFNMVLSKEFECVTDTSAGVRVNYYFYNDDAPHKSVEYATKSIKFFSDKFGEFPYSVFNVVQTKFIQGGMEFPTLVMISDGLESASYGEVIVHETAHQWWQTAVGNNEIEYGFLDEGLAEYSVVLFYENHPEYDLKRESLIKNAENTYKIFCSVYDKLFGGVDTTMTRSLPEYGSEYEYVNIAYIKSCIMLDYLRQTIGDDIFFKGLKRYYSDYKFKNATPYDFVGAYEKSGANANGFFESFFDGKVII